MAEDTHARVRQQRSELFRVSRQELAGDEKSSILACRRLKPRLQSVMHTLPDGTNTHKQHRQTEVGLAWPGVGKVNLLINAVYVPSQSIGSKAPVNKSLGYEF